jgi:hypothetical protein
MKAIYCPGRSEQRIFLTEKFEWFRTDECKALIKQTVQNRLLTESDPVLTAETDTETEPENHQEELF